MKCSNWYLDNKYQSKEDCLSQQNEGQTPTEKSTVASVTDGFAKIESGDTTSFPNTIFPDDQSEEVVTEESQLEFFLPDVGLSEPTTSGDITADVATEIFIPEESFSDNKIEVQDPVETGKAELHIEFGGFKLGLVITGTAIGVFLLVGGLIKLGDVIAEKFIDRPGILDGDAAERSHVPLTSVQPTAPEDSRAEDETVTNFKTACESTLVEGVKSGSFTPPFSPIRQPARTSSLPNVYATSVIGHEKRTMERTQSTIQFNLDDTVGGQFDAIANRNQPAQMDLSRLTDLPSTSQIFRQAEKKEQEGDSDVSATSSGGQSDTSARRKSTRVRRQFKPTQYEDL